MHLYVPARRRLPRTGKSNGERRSNSRQRRLPLRRRERTATPGKQRAAPMVGTHKRNTGPMLASLRCGARTRRGTNCRAPAVSGRKRCRMQAVLPVQVHLSATKTRSNMGRSRKWPCSGGPRHANSIVRSASFLRKLTKPEPKCAKAEGQPTLGGQDHDRAQVKAREAYWAARRSGYGSAQAGHTRLSRTYCFATHKPYGMRCHSAYDHCSHSPAFSEFESYKAGC